MSKQAGKKEGKSPVTKPGPAVKWKVIVIARVPSAKSNAGDAIANPRFASTIFLASGAIVSCEVPNGRQPLLSEDFTRVASLAINAMARPFRWSKYNDFSD